VPAVEKYTTAGQELPVVEKGCLLWKLKGRNKTWTGLKRMEKGKIVD